VSRRAARTLARAVLAATVLLGPAPRAVAASLESVVKDDRGQPVADAVVSLTPVGAPPPATRPAPAVMDQVNKEFVPHVLPVQVGAAVSFPNRDNIRHHVYSFSPAKKFELPLYIGTPAAPVVFDKPGVVALGCNIHDWMVGYIYVLPTPWFARTGPDGLARLPDVPAGSYEVRVWHPQMRGDTEKTARPVSLGAEPARIEYTLGLRRAFRPPRGPGRYDGTPES
jgi:plastocyanin